jgi:hypothetical protein
MVNRFRPRLRRLAGTRTVKDDRLVVLICLPLRLTTTLCTGSSTLTRVRRVRAAQALDALTTGARESRACGEGFVSGVGSEGVTAWIARSKAPLSQVPPGGWGRATPRWSAEGQRELSAESIAGLPSRSAWVSVGPPLSASGPSPGSATPVMSLVSGGKRQLPSLSRLWPSDSMGPRRSSDRRSSAPRNPC